MNFDSGRGGRRRLPVRERRKVRQLGGGVARRARRPLHAGGMRRAARDVAVVVYGLGVARVAARRAAHPLVASRAAAPAVHGDDDAVTIIKEVNDQS